MKIGDLDEALSCAESDNSHIVNCVSIHKMLPDWLLSFLNTIRSIVSTCVPRFSQGFTFPKNLHPWITKTAMLSLKEAEIDNKEQ